MSFNNFKNCIAFGQFPYKLKFADVSPVFKKGCKTGKSNYQLVSIIPVISKICERLIFNQLNYYFESKLSKFQFGFPKGYSAQYCMLLLLEKWKKCIDNKGSVGALMTDTSKAFDSLSHNLLIAKLSAYGMDMISLKLIHSYLNHRNERI